MWYSVQLTYQCDIEHTFSKFACDSHLTSEPLWSHDNESAIAVHLAERSDGNVLITVEPHCTGLWIFTVEQTS